MKKQQAVLVDSTGRFAPIEDRGQARHYFCESLFWASEPKQAAKITWRA